MIELTLFNHEPRKTLVDTDQIESVVDRGPYCYDPRPGNGTTTSTSIRTKSGDSFTVFESYVDVKRAIRKRRQK